VWTENERNIARTTLDGVATLGGTRLPRARRAIVACIIVDTEVLFVLVCLGWLLIAPAFEKLTEVRLIF
jgi:hypothetical protein